MSTFLGNAATVAEAIVVKNDDNRSPPAPALRNAAIERRRRPRSSFVARPVGIQARNDFKLFRVR
jgi:hypothetical protein